MGKDRPDKDDSQVFRGRGRNAVVAIAETPTSGYRWKASSLPAGLSLRETKFISPSAEPVAGGEGRRELHFTADRPGTFDVELELKREWEPEPLEKKRVRIVIED